MVSSDLYDIVLTVDKDVASLLLSHLVENSFSLEGLPIIEVRTTPALAPATPPLNEEQQKAGSALEEMRTLLMTYKKHMYHIQQQIALYGPQDVPFRLINERDQVQTDIQKIEQEIRRLSMLTVSVPE